MYKIPAKTVFLGKSLKYVPECHSTNTLLRQLHTENPLPDGTVLITDQQTAGRGQRGNTWEANPHENLTFSFLLCRPQVQLRDQFAIAMAVSLGVAAAVRRFVPEGIMVKWPNDIMAGDQKLCGILIESSLAGNEISEVVAGIGLNVNQTSFSVPQAVGLASLAGGRLDLPEVLDAVLESIEPHLNQLQQPDGFKTLQREYTSQLYWYRQPHVFETDTHPFVGMIAGIDQDGRLCIQTEQGLQRFMFKEVRFKA